MTSGDLSLAFFVVGVDAVDFLLSDGIFAQGFVGHIAFQRVAEAFLKVFFVGFELFLEFFQRGVLAEFSPAVFGDGDGAGKGHVHQEFGGGNPFGPHAELDAFDVTGVFLGSSIAGIEVVAVF